MFHSSHHQHQHHLSSPSFVSPPSQTSRWFLVIPGSSLFSPDVPSELAALLDQALLTFTTSSTVTSSSCPSPTTTAAITPQPVDADFFHVDIELSSCYDLFLTFLLSNFPDIPLYSNCVAENNSTSLLAVFLEGRGTDSSAAASSNSDDQSSSSSSMFFSAFWRNHSFRLERLLSSSSNTPVTNLGNPCRTAIPCSPSAPYSTLPTTTATTATTTTSPLSLRVPVSLDTTVHNSHPSSPVDSSPSPLLSYSDFTDSDVHSFTTTTASAQKDRRSGLPPHSPPSPPPPPPGRKARTADQQPPQQWPTGACSSSFAPYCFSSTRSSSSSSSSVALQQQSSSSARPSPPSSSSSFYSNLLSDFVGLGDKSSSCYSSIPPPPLPPPSTASSPPPPPYSSMALADKSCLSSVISTSPFPQCFDEDFDASPRMHPRGRGLHIPPTSSSSCLDRNDDNSNHNNNKNNSNKQTSSSSSSTPPDVSSSLPKARHSHLFERTLIPFFPETNPAANHIPPTTHSAHNIIYERRPNNPPAAQSATSLSCPSATDKLIRILLEESADEKEEDERLQAERRGGRTGREGSGNFTGNGNTNGNTNGNVSGNTNGGSSGDNVTYRSGRCMYRSSSSDEEVLVCEAVILFLVKCFIPEMVYQPRSPSPRLSRKQRNKLLEIASSSTEQQQQQQLQDSSNNDSNGSCAYQRADFLFCRGLRRLVPRCVVLDGCNIAYRRTNKVFDGADLHKATEYFYSRNVDELRVVLPEWRLDAQSSNNVRLRNVEALSSLDASRVTIRVPGRELYNCAGGQIKKSCCYDDNVMWQTRERSDGVVISNDHFRDICQDQPNQVDAIRRRLVRFDFSQRAGDFHLQIPPPAAHIASHLPSWLCAHYSTKGRRGHGATNRRLKRWRERTLQQQQPQGRRRRPSSSDGAASGGGGLCDDSCSSSSCDDDDSRCGGDDVLVVSDDDNNNNSVVLNRQRRRGGGGERRSGLLLTGLVESPVGQNKNGVVVTKQQQQQQAPTTTSTSTSRRRRMLHLFSSAALSRLLEFKTTRRHQYKVELELASRLVDAMFKPVTPGDV
eukprot:GHVS01026424.1.p1 GENE.GHVS01026424.1~~GHVS01026424.1.p1  ORF type:complete len:1133 (+),score=362.63 GHVS01026424.1:204-3401(+)